jgi:hypothetical protein
MNKIVASLSSVGLKALKKLHPEYPVPVHRDRVTIRAREICRLIRPDVDPQIIPYVKTRGTICGECFQNVRTHVKKHGGEVIDGWLVWETPPLIVEAEFHSVWLRPDGVLIDITQPLTFGKSTTFLVAEPGDAYEDRNKPGYFLPYDDNEICNRFCEISKRVHQLTYPPGELQTDRYAMTKELMRLTQEKVELIQRVVQSQRK